MASGERRSGGLWKDQRSSPGPFPQCNRKLLEIGAMVLALVLVRILLRDVSDRLGLALS
jgi:hypothetical protein